MRPARKSVQQLQPQLQQGLFLLFLFHLFHQLVQLTDLQLALKNYHQQEFAQFGQLLLQYHPLKFGAHFPLKQHQRYHFLD